MKIVLVALVTFVLVFMSSCGHITQDKSPGSIETDYLRVESVICGKHDIGSNGCIFPEGNVEGELKLFATNSGYIKLTGSSCGVDKKINYDIKNGEWITLDLKSLVGPKLVDDCMIKVYQNIMVPNQDRLQFPILGMVGSVFLGVCPSGVECSYENKQERQGFSMPEIIIHGTEFGPSKYIVGACGSQVVSPTDATTLTTYLPQEKSCMVISSVKSSSGRKFKNFYDLHIFKSTTILMSEPTLTTDGKFTGDSLSAINISNSKVTVGNKGKFDETAEEQIIRFYTSQGRSLVVALSKGVILWVK